MYRRLQHAQMTPGRKENPVQSEGFRGDCLSEVTCEMRPEKCQGREGGLGEHSGGELAYAEFRSLRGAIKYEMRRSTEETTKVNSAQSVTVLENHV